MKLVVAEVDLARRPRSWCLASALLAEASGMDGVVASPREVRIVRSVVKRPEFVVVTPELDRQTLLCLIRNA